jgi:transposase
MITSPSKLKSPAAPIRKRPPKLNAGQVHTILNSHGYLSIKEICRIASCSKASVYRVLFPKPKKSRKRNGRPPKTTEEMDNFIVDSNEHRRLLLPKEIQKLLNEKFGLLLGLTQIKRRLIKAGLNGRVCARKPLLRPINKLKRLLWAIKHQHWTIEQWKRVLWTDEKKFELFNGKRRTFCRRRKNEALRDDTVQATVKHGGGSVMVWGCM